MDSEVSFNENENEKPSGGVPTKVPAKTALESLSLPRAPLRERNNGEAAQDLAAPFISVTGVQPNDTTPSGVSKSSFADSASAPSEDGFSASAPEVLIAKLDTMSFRNNALRSANRELESRIQSMETESIAQNEEIDSLKMQLHNAAAKVQEMQANEEKSRSENLIQALEMRVESEVSERNALRQTVEQQTQMIDRLKQEQTSLKEQMEVAISREASAVEARDGVESDLALLHRQYKTDAFRRRYGELVHENQLIRSAMLEKSQDITTISGKIEAVIAEQQRAAESVAWGMQQVQAMHAESVAEHFVEVMIADAVTEVEHNILRAERESLGSENQRLRDGLRRSCRELEEVKEFAAAEVAAASEREQVLVSNLQAAEDEVEFLINASEKLLNKS